MTDIELVIKIPEEIRLALINNIPLSISQQSICDSCIKQAIINGTPLPKGHGRLIDSDILDKRLRYLFEHKGYSKNLIGTGISLAMGENLDMQSIIDAEESEG